MGMNSDKSDVLYNQIEILPLGPHFWNSREGFDRTHWTERIIETTYRDTKHSVKRGLPREKSAM
jgi:hypothetical protein